MRFFEAQRTARANTNKLIFLFVVSILIIAAMTGTFVALFLKAQTAPRAIPVNTVPIGFYVFLGVIFVVGAASYFRMRFLESGIQIAAMLGGIEVIISKSEGKEKILVNVVEEMAIAAGIPTPRVFVLKSDSSINAFAAGFAIQGSVIGITQGALDNLNRDELQGLIGHEISHILNGDMKLNIELAGAIFGLIMISRFGRILMDTNRNRNSRNNQGGQLQLIGFLVFVLGLLGMFFARIIQSLVSRQREFLADASSAQFTRNPKSLAQVLSKISFHYGSLTPAQNLMDISHIFFSATDKPSFFSNLFSGLFATHPQPQDRVLRLLPQIRPDQILESMGEMAKDMDIVSRQEILAEKAQADEQKKQNLKSTANQLVRSLGALSLANLQDSSKRLQAIPDEVRQFIADQEKCFRVLRYLMSPEKMLENNTDFSKALAGFVGSDNRNRIILLQIALDSLRQMPEAGRLEIFNRLREEAMADGKLTAAERIVLLMAQDYLLTTGKRSDDSGRNLGLNRPTLPTNPRSIEEAVGHVLAHLTELDTTGVMVNLELKDKIEKIAAKELSLPANSLRLVDYDQLAADIQILRAVTTAYKEKFVATLWLCIQADDRIETLEKELGRVVCFLIRVPVPPVMVG